jgi:spermidine/putrescine-binding protein
MKIKPVVHFGTSLMIVFTLLLTACASETQKPTTEPTATSVPNTPTIQLSPMQNSILVVPNTPTVKGSTQPAPQDSKATLLVEEWSGYEKNEFWQPYIDQHPGIKVDYAFIPDDAESFAKALTNPDIDIMHPCANYFSLFVEKGLVQPIDTSRIKNWNSVYPELAKLGQIDGKQYFIPWDWGFNAILVRTDKVKTIPNSWNDLWNPEYKGHMSFYDSGNEAYYAAALALGFDPYNVTPDQDAKIKQKLIDLIPNLVDYWSDPTQVSNQMASGDIWVIGNAWNESFRFLKQENIPVKVYPVKPKTLIWLMTSSMPDWTPNHWLTWLTTKGMAQVIKTPFPLWTRIWLKTWVWTNRIFCKTRCLCAR